MNQFEKDEIERLPEKYQPVGAWRYVGYNILFSIPLVGFIFLIVFACSDANINRRSYARSYFCVFLIVAIIGIIMGGIVAILFFTVGPTILEQLRPLLEQLRQIIPIG